MELSELKPEQLVLIKSKAQEILKTAEGEEDAIFALKKYVESEILNANTDVLETRLDIMRYGSKLESEIDILDFAETILEEVVLENL